VTSNKRNVDPINVGIVLLIAGIIVVVLLLTVSGGDDDAGGGAESAAQSYVDAQKNGDFEQVCELLSDQFRQQLGGDNCPRFLEEQSSGIARRELTVIAVNEDGDQATARLETGGESGKPTELELSLVRQDGDWRIASVRAARG
jgi:hypothetical protein